MTATEALAELARIRAALPRRHRKAFDDDFARAREQIGIVEAVAFAIGGISPLVCQFAVNHTYPHVLRPRPCWTHATHDTDQGPRCRKHSTAAGTTGAKVRG